MIVNPTIPGTHFAVSRAALMAGKHVRSEKPLALKLIGLVQRVAAVSSMPTQVRTITSELHCGQTSEVETPTTMHALQRRVGDAVGLVAHARASPRHLQIYGSLGTLFCQDPNFFGGTIEVIDQHENNRVLDGADHPLSVTNRTMRNGKPRADCRSAGLADMADAIRTGREHRRSLERALHTLDVLTAIPRSGETGRFETLSTSCTRPEPFGADAARALMKETVAA